MLEERGNSIASHRSNVPTGKVEDPGKSDAHDRPAVVDVLNVDYLGACWPALGVFALMAVVTFLATLPFGPPIKLLVLFVGVLGGGAACFAMSDTATKKRARRILSTNRAADAEASERTIATNAEVSLLLRAWLSEVEPPPVERLSDLR